MLQELWRSELFELVLGRVIDIYQQQPMDYKEIIATCRLQQK